MSDNRESSSDEMHHQSKSIFKLDDSLKQKLVNIPEVLEFIESLLTFIEKQKRKLKRVRSKLKKKIILKGVGVQTQFDKDDDDENQMHSEEKKHEEEEVQPIKSLVEDIKNAAEQAMQHSGFVYEETSGMYYDYNTGYYYNAEYGLYYDGSNGVYMSYNQDTQSYEYHSQVSTAPDMNENQQDNNFDQGPSQTKSKMKRKKKTENKLKARKKQNIEKAEVDLEEGECSESSSIESVTDNEEINSDNSDVSKQWPPCMRVIVEESTVSKIKVGSLQIITCDGGTIGREGDHSIVIPDINISKHHLKIIFDKESNKYQAIDMGSRNGTLLNGKRMSASKQESDLYDIVHGSKIQLGTTILLCHIHEGSQTCGHCEPGLIEQQDKVETYIKTSKSERHKHELKNLKKKFGMNSYEEGKSKLASGYTDRAQKRRETIGSQNPHEKTKTASLNESIPSENKGFKLLSKMGWKEGQSLGKEGQGIVEPIGLVSNPGKAGVGSEAQPVLESVNENKQNIWKKAQERFQKLPETSGTEFNNSD